MRVLFQGRTDLLTTGGGDKIQIEHTAHELRALGVEVDIATNSDVDYSKYDLVHVFQLDWVAETSLFVINAKKAGKKVVFSPIHHDINEVKLFDDTYVFDFRRISRVLFKDQFHRDVFKNMYRSLFNASKLKPTLISAFKGLKNLHTQALQSADVVLVQTNMEAQDLEETYGVQINWVKVENGVGKHFLNYLEAEEVASEDSVSLVEGLTGYILCVGRIEPRKNQLSIIEAVDIFRKTHDVNIPLIFVGKKKMFPHFEYTHRLDTALKKYDWIHHIDSIPYEQMPQLYKNAKIYVSASWFESTGLTCLEALFCNTRVVASGDRVKEYIHEMASYCNPADIKSIEAAIAKEYFSNEIPKVGTEFLSLTWENTAKKTLTVYNSLLETRINAPAVHK